MSFYTITTSDIATYLYHIRLSLFPISASAVHWLAPQLICTFNNPRRTTYDYVMNEITKADTVISNH